MESAMDLALQLFGYLILTVLAIVVPIFIVLLSIFQEGVSKLSEQYENQKSKSEENLKKQWKKQTQLKKSDKVEEMEERMKKIKRSIKEIKTIKKTAETKLVYLDPKRQMARLFIILMISFSGVVLATLIKSDIYYTVLISLVSVIFFTTAVIILWKLLGIIVEVKKVIDEEKREAETKTVDALLALQEKLTKVKEETPLFLKDVYLTIGGKDIKDEEKEFEFPINSKKELKLLFHNHEDFMVKNLEVAIYLPSDFIVKKSTFYSVYIGTDGQQMICFELDKIHGKTYMGLGYLIFTPITEAEYDISSSIKAENIKPINRKFKFKIKEEIVDEIEEEIPEDVAPF